MMTAKHVAIGSAVVILGGGVAWLVYRQFKKVEPVAQASGNSVADSQTKETAGNIISTIVDQSMQTVGLGTPRGIRNNNPLNIKWSAANNWAGQVSADSGGFVIFDTPINGIRAAARILNSYKKIGVTSITQIVQRWTSGDSTKIQSSYIAHVSKAVNIPADAPLNSNNWAAVLSAMTYFENGQNPYTFDQFVAGVASAGV